MKVAVIMGSTSDLEIMSQAINVLEGFGVEVVKKVISAHRTPDLMCEFAKSAKSNGIGAIIAGAGGAAHVAGVVLQSSIHSSGFYRIRKDLLI